jgi:hypothetical protein
MRTTVHSKRAAKEWTHNRRFWCSFSCRCPHRRPRRSKVVKDGGQLPFAISPGASANTNTDTCELTTHCCRCQLVSTPSSLPSLFSLATVYPAPISLLSRVRDWMWLDRGVRNFNLFSYTEIKRGSIHMIIKAQWFFSKIKQWTMLVWWGKVDSIGIFGCIVSCEQYHIVESYRSITILWNLYLIKSLYI